LQEAHLSASIARVCSAHNAVRVSSLVTSVSRLARSELMAGCAKAVEMYVVPEAQWMQTAEAARLQSSCTLARKRGSVVAVVARCLWIECQIESVGSSILRRLLEWE